jgi:hypothetical protein
MNARVLWQSCVVAGMGCLASGVSLAQTTVDCSSVAEDGARLKCYDEQAVRQKKAVAAVADQAATTAPGITQSPAATLRATAPAAAAVSPTPATAPAAATASPAPSAASTPARAKSPSSDFGLDEETLRKRQAAANPDAPADPEQLVARVKAVAKKPRGEYRITLDDGQVWEETQHSSSSIPPRVGDTVTLKRGMLGSYFLERGAGLALRVKRTD